MAYSSNSTPIPQTQFNSEIIYYTKSGVVSIYKGSAVFLRSGNATNGLQVGDIFVGICKDTVKLTERETVGVDSKGIFAFNCNDESVTVGSVAYIDNGVNNATITTTAPLTGLKVAIGNVVAVENGFVFVRVDNAIFNTVVDVTPEPVVEDTTE